MRGDGGDWVVGILRKRRWPRYRTRFHTPVLTFLAAVGLLFISSSAVVAHGGGTPQLTDAEAGPYRIFAWTEPEPWRAGEVHLSVMVTLAPAPGTEEDKRAAANRLDKPVNDAEVVVTFAPVDVPDGAMTLPAELQALGGNISYEIDTELPTAGTWQVAIAVDGEEGVGDAAFEVRVLPPRTVNVWITVGGALLAIVVLGIVGMQRHRKQS